MYSEKNAGKNQFQFYKNEMTSEIFEKIIMKNEINDAIKNEDFEVFYQAQIDIQENKIVGAEALIRWNYKNTRLIFPNEFISYAEETKLIIPIGEFVLRKACSFFKKLQDLQLLNDGIIAVNISSVQIKNSDILKTIKECLEYSKLEAKYLELELTESYLMDNVQESILVLTKLKELGIKIVEVGAVEVIEENEEYTKKYFPYTVQSDVNRLGRFFYWLENSNQLVTFKGSPLDIQLLDSQGVLGQITVKMKVGAYFNEVKTVEEKPVEEGKGGANE